MKQYLVDGVERGVVIGTVLVDMSATYDTISNTLLPNKTHRISYDREDALYGEVLLLTQGGKEVNDSGHQLQSNSPKETYELKNAASNMLLSN